jgi:hypothetical protein
LKICATTYHQLSKLVNTSTILLFMKVLIGTLQLDSLVTVFIRVLCLVIKHTSFSRKVQWICDFYISLTAHLSIIHVNNQPDTLFSMYLFIYFSSLHVSSNPVLIIRRIEMCQYIIWYISLCVGDCLVCLTSIPGSHLQTVIYTRWCIDTFQFYWRWALGCLKHVENWNK